MIRINVMRNFKMEESAAVQSERRETPGRSGVHVPSVCAKPRAARRPA